jgi:hypothetical protein
MIEDCRNRDSKLSAWDADFLDSIEVQLDGNNSLSDKQSDKLDEIWEKVTANG